jgi:hypothetical protein
MKFSVGTVLEQHKVMRRKKYQDTDSNKTTVTWKKKL